MRKNKAIFCLFEILAGLSVIGIFTVDTVGRYTLVEEVFKILLLLCLFLIALFAVIIQNKNNKSNVKEILPVATIMLVLGWVILFDTKDVLMDLSRGTEQVLLSDCKLEKSGGDKGIFNLRYYLVGTDEAGEKRKIKISRNYFYNLEEGTYIVELYLETNRATKIQKH